MSNKKKLFKRLVGVLMAMCCLLGAIPVQSAFAAGSYHTITSDSGWGFAKTAATVWLNSTGNSAYGSVSAGEGFTILSKANNRYCINYSTSSSPGWKEGWIDAAYVDTQYMGCSKAGVINSSSTTWYCPFTNSVQAGSVSANERVSILGKVNNYYQIEYNTSSGRKCGWVPTSKVTLYNNGGIIHWRFMDDSSPTPDNSHNYTGRTIPVYQSPFVSTANGSISNGEYYRIGGGALINGVYFLYVEYYYGNSANNIWKSGFILLADT